MPRENRRLVSAFVGGWIGVLVLAGIRPGCGPHAWLRDRIEPALAVTGLSQVPWQMYVPPDRRNIRYVAKIELTGGRTVTWESPDWAEMSPLSKFIHARRMNYFGNLANVADDRNVPAWEALAGYLARSETEYVAHVELAARIADVPPLEQREVPARPFLELGPPVFLVEWKP